MPSLMDLPDMMVSSKACKTGMSNGVATIIRPVAWTAHLRKDRDFIYDGEMTAGVAGCEMAATTMALASETRGDFKGQQERRISILFPKQPLMNFRSGKWFSLENIGFPLFDMVTQCSRVIEKVLFTKTN